MGSSGDVTNLGDTPDLVNTCLNYWPYVINGNLSVEFSFYSILVSVILNHEAIFQVK